MYALNLIVVRSKERILIKVVLIKVLAKRICALANFSY